MPGESDTNPIIDEVEVEYEINLSENSTISDSNSGTRVSAVVKQSVRSERKDLIIISSIIVVIAVLSGIALGIGYAVGDSQLVPSGMVTSDCAPCADMGAAILKQGGSAVDATVTTVLCNGVINLHSSGIGGAGFLIVRNHKSNRTVAIDFRSTAPGSTSMDFYTNDTDYQFGSLSVATPGEIAGLKLAHTMYGKLPWSELVKPVAQLARNGFSFTADSHFWITSRLGLVDRLKSYNGKLYKLLYKDDGTLKAAGTTLYRSDYAEALDLISEDQDSFYKGKIAADITETLNKYDTREGKSGGTVSLADLKEYSTIARQPLIFRYHDAVIETVPPPAGGVITLHILGILQKYNFKPEDLDKPLTYQRIVEAFKFAYATFPNNHEFADLEEMNNFTSSMLTPEHCEAIRLRINDTATFEPSYYDPHYKAAETSGTTAVSVVDSNELYVASISSINNLYGSGLMTDTYGILLNNDMDDFDKPDIDENRLRGNPDNYVSPGRRPRSSMSPSVFYNARKKCELRGAVGGIGGPKIITATAQYLINILSFGLSSQQAVDKPRMHHSLLPNELLLELDYPTDVKGYLNNTIGHNVTDLTANRYLAGVSAVAKRNTTLFSGADFRKQGKSSRYVKGV